MPEFGQELDGLTVISLEQAVAAPYCGLLLADAGARVIKVERPSGDFARTYDRAANGESAYFVWLNGGKESIALDLDGAEDEALLRRMLAGADVFLHNLAPGSLRRRNLAGEALRAGNPGLISCEITGYGRSGAHATMKAYDLLVQAESGLCSVTGSPEEPARVGVSVCDLATGLTAFAAILRALVLRGRTGRGSDLSIAMFDVLADWMNVPLMFQEHTGRAPERIGVAHATLAPYGTFPTASGEAVLIAVQSNREWALLAERILDRPELATDPRFRTNPDRLRNRDELDALISAVFSTVPRAELMERLRAAGIACGVLNSVEDLARHPQLRRRPATIAGMAVGLASLPVAGRLSVGGRVPLLDEDGPAIRREFAATRRPAARGRKP